jgi:hypothetical protein
MYYFAIITSVIMSRGDPGETNRPCLRTGCHSCYQSITGVIYCIRSYFQKPTVRIRLEAHIKTIVILTGSKLTGFYFLQINFL